MAFAGVLRDFQAFHPYEPRGETPLESAMKPMTSPGKAILAALCALALGVTQSRASVAYGSINNFDTVNDTGHECHGFEIEIEDCHSTDISYTYDYNHYGTSKITEGTTADGRPKTLIRWESKKNPDGSWASYTAVPSGPIAATDGHQFTNPSVNFGGEHFGVGYGAPVGAIRYNWLIDDGSGNLINGGNVQVATPTFVYYPAVAAQPAQVQAAIQPPPAPEVPVKEFGPPVWVKEIRTTTHNNNKVHLRDLVSDDPDDAHDKNWRNGEPDEVEVEWQLLQTEYSKVNGGVNGLLEAAPEDLDNGDEVVTRRYEFFEYTGPIDNETGEAMAGSVGPDDIHGIGTKTVNGVETDLSTIPVVGEYKGSQMAAVDADGHMDLVDHLPEGAENQPYAARKLVIDGPQVWITFLDGALPTGMEYDEVTGILSGTPTESGEFQIRVTATDFTNPDIEKNYTLRIAAAGADLAPACLLDTAAAPAGTGVTSGDGAYAPGTAATVEAVPEPGYRFANWTDNGQVIGTDPVQAVTLDVNHSLVANFVVDVPQWTITASASPAASGTITGAGPVGDGTSVTLTAMHAPGYVFSSWIENGVQVSNTATFTFTAVADRTLVAVFTAMPTYSVTATPNNPVWGSVSGAGTYTGGSSATVNATPADGYVFSKWTVGGNTVSTSPGYTFTVNANKTLVANFIEAGSQQIIAAVPSNPAWGGVTGAGSYLAGDTATLVAIPNPGYAFSKWKEGGATVSTSASYSFTVGGGRTLTAQFIEAFVVTANVSPPAGGTTEMDSLTYKTGENAKAKATPADGFTFANWTENGVVVSTEADYSFNITGSRVLVANFTADAGITVTAAASPATGGSVSGDGVYQTGDPVTVSAVANEGYAFVKWTVNGATVGTDPDYGFLADANIALVAHFAPPVAINASASPPAGGTVDGAGDYAVGAEAALTAIPNPGYAFVGWTEGPASVPGGLYLTFPVTATRTLVANFVEVPKIEAVAGVPGSGTMDITWPAAAAGWVLEESADLTNWAPSALPVVTTGDTRKATVPTTGQGRYFRLAHP